MYDDDEEVSVLNTNGSTPLSQDKLTVSFSLSNNRRKLPTELENCIDKIWARRCTDNSTLYNGSKFRLSSVTSGENGR